MKKLLMVLFVIFLVGCSSGETAKESAPAEQSTPETVTQQDAPPAAEVQAEAPKEAAPVASMDFDSMFLSGAKCVSSKDGQTATLYFKGGKMRMDTLPVDAHAIYDEDTMYAWSGTQGTKMSRKDIEAMAAKAGQQIKSHEQVKSEMKDPGVNCEPASVSSDLFVPPSDVQFIDLAQMMQQQYGTSMPQQ